MSDSIPTGDFPPEDRDDLIAAEYVLGVLPIEERRAAQARAETDGGFAQRIARWEQRLDGLNADYAEAPVDPALYPRIEAALFGPAPAPRRNPVWRLWLGALTATAAALVLALFLWPQAPLVARMEAGDLAFDATFQAGILQIAHSGPAAGEGQDYELWAIGEDGVPRSLGLLRGPRTEVPAALEPGITLAVSLEPLGGAPGDGPTGPVLAAAPLAVN